MYKEIFDNSPVSILIGEVCEINDYKDIIIKEKNKVYIEKCKKDINKKYFIEDLLEVNKDLAREAIEECMTRDISEFMEYITSIGKFCKINFRKLNDNHIVITIKDILKFESNILEQALQNEKAVIFLQHKDGRYIYASSEFINIVNKYNKKKFKNIIGRYDVDILPQHVLNIIREKIDEVFSGNEISVYSKVEFDEFKLNTVINAIREKEEVIGVIFSAIDKNNEDTLSNKRIKKEKELKEICKSIPDFIYFIDRNNKLLYYNKHFLNANESFNEDITKIFGGRKKFDEFLKIQHDINKEIFISKETHTYSFVVMMDKLHYYEVVKVPLLDNNGEVMGICAISHDLTDIYEGQKKIEDIKQEFFSNISHEFRTPLNLILSTIQLLKLKVQGDEIQDKYNKYFNMIEKNGVRLLKCINAVINATDLNTKEIIFNGKVDDIVYKIEDIFDNMIEFAKYEGIDMIFDTDYEEKYIIYDEDKIETIITNLLSNALKYTKNSIKLKLTSKDDFIEIRVKDNGIGIKKEDINKVFEKFKQVSSKKNKGEITNGSGIGLYLVKLYTELHGGTVEIKSKFGAGSEFIIRIPEKIK